MNCRQSTEVFWPFEKVGLELKECPSSGHKSSRRDTEFWKPFLPVCELQLCFLNCGGGTLLFIFRSYLIFVHNSFPAIVNNGAMITGIQILVEDHVFNSVGYIHRSRIAESHGSSIFNCPRNLHIVWVSYFWTQFCYISRSLRDLWETHFWCHSIFSCCLCKQTIRDKFPGHSAVSWNLGAHCFTVFRHSLHRWTVRTLWLFLLF